MHLLKSLRKSKGWNTKRMGEYLGYSPRTIEDFEQGRRKVPKRVMNVLLKLRPGKE